MSLIPGFAVLSNLGPLRLVRLLKLARMAKLKRILDRWESYMAIALSYRSRARQSRPADLDGRHEDFAS